MRTRDRTDGHYDPVTIWLHWATAALVAILWIMGQTIDFLPRGPLRANAWSLHVTLGIVLGLVLVGRVFWRAGPGRGLPAADPGLLHAVAKATHYALYGLLAAVVVLGVANALVRGFDLFGLWTLPQIGDPSLRRPVNELHELAANLTLIVAFVHAAAALVHHYVWRDGVLRRMIPAARGTP
jgi:cytochrome b561